MKIPLIFLFITFPFQLCYSQQETKSLERIFYCSFTPAASNIYISRDGGKTVEIFSDHPSLEYDAVISPDGEWVVFTSERNGIPQLYAKRVNGNEEPGLLIKSNSFQDQAAFSHDGKTLAFVGSHEDNAEIYVIPFLPETSQDVSAARNLTNHPGGDFRPAFSPDGSLIAFSSDRGHPVKQHEIFSFARSRTGDIYTMDTNGNSVTRLTDSDKWDGSPVWSRDGNSIYFYSQRDGEAAIFKMNADGSGPEKINVSNDPAYSPLIAPNGALIYVVLKDDCFKLKVYDSTTTSSTFAIDKGPFDQLNLYIHDASLLVFDGAEEAEAEPVQGAFGFRGPILAHLPDTISFAGLNANFYGVRRAFVAAPSLTEPILYYNNMDVGRNLLDLIAIPGYSFFLSPLIGILFLIAGIFFAIKLRKQTGPGKFILFCVVAVVAGAVGSALLFYLFTNPRFKVPQIRIFMAGLVVLFAVLAFLFYRSYSKAPHPSGSSTLRFNYTLLFGCLIIFPLTFLLFPYNFIKDENYFYAVNYQTNERKKLFKMHWVKDKEPLMGQVLDNKISGDGKYLLHTQSFFTAKEKASGDIWQYDLGTGEQTKISDSPFNDGFADMSTNGKIVFRSGRTGFFDIYLKEVDQITNLTNDEHKDNFPAISIKGDKITFVSDRLHVNDSLKNMDIFLMELQADKSWSAPRKISSSTGQNGHPHFSPDGEWIIYTTDAFGIHDEAPLVSGLIFAPQLYGEIVAYHIGTKERYRLTHNKWEEGAPMWVKGLGYQ